MKRFIYSLFALQLVLLPNFLSAEEGQAPATPPPSADQGLGQTLIMIAIALLFFYIILWRPEQKRRKAMEEQRSSLKKGDRVTVMGILGTIVKIQEHTVIVRMYDGSKLEFLKAAISEVHPGTEEDAKRAEREDSTLVKMPRSDEE